MPKPSPAPKQPPGTPRVFPAGCETVTAQRHEVDGRVLATIVGFDRDGVAKWTTCLHWDTPWSLWDQDDA